MISAGQSVSLPCHLLFRHRVFIPAINTVVVPLYSFYHCTYFMWEVDSNLSLRQFPRRTDGRTDADADGRTDGRMISCLCNVRARAHAVPSFVIRLSLCPSASLPTHFLAPPDVQPILRAGIFGFIRGVSRHSLLSLSFLRDLSDRRRNFQNGTGR